MIGVTVLENLVRGKKAVMLPRRLIEITVQLEHLHALMEGLKGVLKATKTEATAAGKVLGRDVSHVAGGKGPKSQLHLGGASGKSGAVPVKRPGTPPAGARPPVRPGQQAGKAGAGAAGHAVERVPGWLRHDLIVKEQVQKWLTQNRHNAEHWAKQRLNKLYNLQHRVRLALDKFNITYQKLKMAPPHSVAALQAELKELGSELEAAMSAVAAA